MQRMRMVLLLLGAQLAVAGVAIAIIAGADFPLVGGDGGEAGSAEARGRCAGGRAPRPALNRVSERRLVARVDRQLAFGPRPAGSRASRRLARELRLALPGGRYQAVPGGLRNVVGTVPGRDPSRTVVVGAHYDTKDQPGFLGANDAASGTAAVTEIARSLRPRQLRPTIVFVLFDGEESPRGTPDRDFEEKGLRGSRVAARAFRGAEAMILLDFIGDKDLSIPREENSDERLWSKLRGAARRAGVGCVFPARSSGAILDDHVPFIEAGVPSIDLIDFDFPCFHKNCDNRSAISGRNIDASSEAVRELIASL